ncbi:MAG: GNAT family N-acetyltransferase [Moraxellaceae bacterium]|nr:GNAT family N-acetyltransferase [Pseudomonadales bacterium]MCP5173984.1 GNAT family N-acetyltransferase [Moraxellaceae bacterium]HQV22943.1 GNAT family N-acetyltransferase [Agitococcus sp.]
MYRIEQLSKHHQRDQFDCGEPALNTFFQKYANQQQKRHLSRVYVALDSQEQVVGFYSLSATSIEFENAPQQLKRNLAPYPVPAVLIGRLAIDKTRQGQGVGRYLLAHALAKTKQAMAIVGIVAVVVDAKNQEAVSFYRRFGFELFCDDGLRLFYPTIALTENH